MRFGPVGISPNIKACSIRQPCMPSLPAYAQQNPAAPTSQFHCLLQSQSVSRHPVSTRKRDGPSKSVGAARVAGISICSKLWTAISPTCHGTQHRGGENTWREPRRHATTRNEHVSSRQRPDKDSDRYRTSELAILVQHLGD